jgi:hypothetical protein
MRRDGFLRLVADRHPSGGKSRLKGSDQGEAMYTHILIPTDGSELAVQHGVALAKRIAAKVTMLTVLPPEMITTDTQMIEIRKARMQKDAEQILGAIGGKCPHGADRYFSCMRLR